MSFYYLRDQNFRSTLKAHLSKQEFVLNDPQCLVIDELGLCQGNARIDVAVLNGKVHGYEIKSDMDTLERVESQLSVYTKIFDYLTFVVGEKHIVNIEEKIPDWCGISMVFKNGKDEIKLRQIRRAKRNKNVDPYSLVQLLWKNEAIALLRKFGNLRGIQSKPRKVLWERLATDVSAKQLSSYVRETLKSRKGWRVDCRQKLGDGLPQLCAKL